MPMTSRTCCRTCPRTEGLNVPSCAPWRGIQANREHQVKSFHIDCELEYDVTAQTLFIFNIAVPTGFGQRVRSEAIAPQPGNAGRRVPRCRRRQSLPARQRRPGRFSIRYLAAVDVGRAGRRSGRGANPARRRHTGGDSLCPVEPVLRGGAVVLPGMRRVRAHRSGLCAGTGGLRLDSRQHSLSRRELPRRRPPRAMCSPIARVFAAISPISRWHCAARSIFLRASSPGTRATRSRRRIFTPCSRPISEVAGSYSIRPNWRQSTASCASASAATPQRWRSRLLWLGAAAPFESTGRARRWCGATRRLANSVLRRPARRVASRTTFSRASVGDRPTADANL